MPIDGPKLERLSVSVTKIKALLSNNQVIELTRMMEETGFVMPTSKEMDRLDLSPSQRDRLCQYLKEIGENGSLMAVALSLLELSKVEMNLPIEICWTGPSSEPHIRMTWPALSEMILDAKESILIVGYAITTNMKKIMEYLEEKSKEGVKLIFMIDRVEEKKDFLQWLKRLHPPIEVYDRPQDTDDPLSALHTKCIVVDEKVAMFGSANLTYHGRKGNIELGLVIKDERTVKTIVRLIYGLRNEMIKYEIPLPD